MVILGHEYQQTINKLMKSVKSDPKNPRYFEEFLFNKYECGTPLHIFIWNPLEAFTNTTVKCLKHDCEFYGADWTCNVTTPNSRLNPRLVFCLFYNVILIQRYYKCSNKEHPCLMASGSRDFMDLLDRNVSTSFPYKLYHRSAYSFKLINFLFEMLVSGNNFSQIAQSIANIKAVQFGSLKGLTNPLMSFPSPSKLETMFLDIFQSKKHSYMLALEKVVPEHVISVDHTFKVGKNVGGFRSTDGKFVRAEKKLFIVLDETLRIASWKMTSSTTHEEVRGILENLNERCKEIFMILTDNCCKDRQFYVEIFGDVLVRLDLFHGVQRVVNTIPVNHFCTETRNFLNDFGLVFRAAGDLEQSRGKPTPQKDEILSNIDNFILLNSEFISNLPQSKKDDFNKAIESIKKHVNKECLSDIGVGHGTEGNEGLHRLLNRSCLRGATVISPELMESILFVLFYYHNSKIDGKPHTCNVSIIPVFPPEHIDFDKKDPVCQIEDSMLNSVKQINKPSQLNQKNEQEKVVIEKALDQIKVIVKTLVAVEQMIKLRHVNPEFLFRRANASSSLCTVGQHTQLEFNLSAFGLQQDPMEGLNFIKMIIVHLYQSVSFETDCPLVQYFKSIGLTGLVDEDSSCISSNTCLNLDVADHNEMNEDKQFQILNLCSNLLKIPIIVIQPFYRLSVFTILPEHQLTDKPIILSYDSENRRIMGTKPLKKIENLTSESELHVPCHCKKGCTESTSKRKCPCVCSGKECSMQCKCRNCRNNKKVVLDPSGCKCVSGCVNVEGKRKSKCKCLKLGLSCINCSCLNCLNPAGQNNKRKDSSCESKSRATNSHTTYKKKRTEDYVSSTQNSVTLGQGPWSLNETVCLYVSSELTLRIHGCYEVEEIHKTYNFFSGEKLSTEDLMLKAKTINQIKGKLKVMGYLLG